MTFPEGYAHIEARPSEIRAIDEIYAFNEVNFKKLGELLSLWDIYAESDKVEHFQEILSAINRLIVLDTAFHQELKADSEIKKFFEHDLKNIIGKILFVKGSLNLDEYQELAALDSKQLTNKLKEIRVLLGFFYHDWPAYGLIIEDILARKIEKEGGTIQSRAADIDLFNKALKYFVESAAGDGQVRAHLDSKKNKKKSYAFPTLQEGEEIRLPPGIFIDGIFNILRNACKERVKAEQVTLDIAREGNELVTRVIDDGVGMSSEVLATVFQKGVSHTGSTGLGLTGLDQRLAVGGVKFQVASTPFRRFSLLSSGMTEEAFMSQPDPRDTFKKSINFFPVNLLTEDKARLIKLLEEKRSSTIFEIRLPITKKEL